MSMASSIPRISSGVARRGAVVDVVVAGAHVRRHDADVDVRQTALDLLDWLNAHAPSKARELVEKLDLTPERVATLAPPGHRGAIVRSYMAHHQGMSLLAIANALHDNCMQGRFHAEAKNLAAAPRFGEESLALVEWMQAQPALAQPALAQGIFHKLSFGNIPQDLYAGNDFS